MMMMMIMMIIILMTKIIEIYIVQVPYTLTNRRELRRL